MTIDNQYIINIVFKSVPISILYKENDEYLVYKNVENDKAA